MHQAHPQYHIARPYAQETTGTDHYAIRPCDMPCVLFAREHMSECSRHPNERRQRGHQAALLVVDKQGAHVDDGRYALTVRRTLALSIRLVRRTASLAIRVADLPLAVCHGNQLT